MGHTNSAIAIGIAKCAKRPFFFVVPKMPKRKEMNRFESIRNEKWNSLSEEWKYEIVSMALEPMCNWLLADIVCLVYEYWNHSLYECLDKNLELKRNGKRISPYNANIEPGAHFQLSNDGFKTIRNVCSDVLHTVPEDTLTTTITEEKEFVMWKRYTAGIWPTPDYLLPITDDGAYSVRDFVKLIQHKSHLYVMFKDHIDVWKGQKRLGKISIPYICACKEETFHDFVFYNDTDIVVVSISHESFIINLLRP